MSEAGKDTKAAEKQADKVAEAGQEKPEWVVSTHGPLPDELKDQYRAVE